MRYLLAVLISVAVLLAPAGGPAPARAVPGDPAETVTLYFFWAEGCPHCAAAKPLLAELAERHPGLSVRSFEVTGSAENQRRLAAMVEKFGLERTAVPMFFLGDDHWVGYLENVTAGQLETAVARCLARGCPDAGAGVFDGSGPPARAPASSPDVLRLPFFGEIDAGGRSLALITVAIAAVDGVNPCSLWVLSILLALTLRTGSRRTIAVIGLVFIFVTALMYALFIAGLFSIFAVVSFAPWVRAVVAVIAILFAAVNIKDFFWFKSGVSLSIPESSKPGIYQRMRGVLGAADSLPGLVAATAVLAAGVSFVELACTAGFPILWTNIVAARDVSPAMFVLLLGLYMLVYQLDELVIFGAAVTTMRVTKLQEKQGRFLKLLSGMLMLSLAVVMLVNPALMNSVGTSLLVFAAAGAATALAVLVDRRVRSARRADPEAAGRPRS